MSGSCRMTGDWHRVNVTLNKLHSDLVPTLKAKISEDGEVVLEKLTGHIYSGDLGWTPLSPDTIRLKQGNSTVLIETGSLAGSFTVQRFEFDTGITVFIGIPDGASHPSGVSASTLMLWIEQGTSRMPARPLIQPTYEEIKELLPEGWLDVIKQFM